MSYYPSTTWPVPERTETDAFSGYDHRLRCPEGSWYDTENLTTDDWPAMSSRRPRRVGTAQTAPQGLSRRGAAAWVDGDTLYYGGVATGVTGLSQPRLIRAAAAPEDAPEGSYWYDTTNGVTSRRWGAGWEVCPYPQKQLVSMGAYLCVFPDGVYLNTANLSDYGAMAAEYRSPAGSTVTVTPAASDGAERGEIHMGAAPPEDPENLTLWLDTSGVTHVLRQYAAHTEEWTAVADPMVKLTFTTRGVLPALLRTGDGVRLSGCAAEGELAQEAAALNGTVLLRGVGGGETEPDWLLIPGLLRRAFTAAGRVTVRREVPEMDFVVGCRNRLWGCRYGLRDGRAVNELYACALGDFTNWNRFDGLSTDAWAASVGSDGPFTGAAVCLGSPCFFKEDTLHRVGVSPVGAHTVGELPCRGIREGSARSAALVGEILYYHAPEGICAYDGSMPTLISQALGDTAYRFAVGGGCGSKYYVSMLGDGGWSLFAYDTRYGLWLREDATQALTFARGGDNLWYVDAADRRLKSLRGEEGDGEGTVLWRADTGLLGCRHGDRKYLERLELRLKLEENAQTQVWVEYDSSGRWESVGQVTSPGLDAFLLSVRPRRCDHLRLRLTGRGEARLLRLGKVWEVARRV